MISDLDKPLELSDIMPDETKYDKMRPPKYKGKVIQSNITQFQQGHVKGGGQGSLNLLAQFSEQR